MSNTIKPVSAAPAPVPNALLCAVVMRGTIKPRVEEVKSRMALGFGVSVPMPTLSCAPAAMQQARKQSAANGFNLLFMVKFFYIVYAAYTAY